MSAKQTRRRLLKAQPSAHVIGLHADGGARLVSAQAGFARWAAGDVGAALGARCARAEASTIDVRPRRRCGL